MQNISGESVFTQVIIDGESLLDDLSTFKNEAEAEPPVNNTFSYNLEGVECKIVR